MEIVFVKDLAGVGEKGEKKNVKAGFARNYLLPQGLAVLSSDPASQKFEEAFKVREEKSENTVASENIAGSIQNLKLEFVLKSEKGKKTYTGIMAKKVSEELEKKYQIHAEKVDLKGALKEAGENIVKIKVGSKEFEVMVSIATE